MRGIPSLSLSSKHSYHELFFAQLYFCILGVLFSRSFKMNIDEKCSEINLNLDKLLPG
jgi:hypothetical protein